MILKLRWQFVSISNPIGVEHMSLSPSSTSGDMLYRRNGGVMEGLSLGKWKAQAGHTQELGAVRSFENTKIRPDLALQTPT